MLYKLKAALLKNLNCKTQHHLYKDISKLHLQSTYLCLDFHYYLCVETFTVVVICRMRGYHFEKQVQL